MPADWFENLPPEVRALGSPLALYRNRPLNTSDYSDRRRVFFAVSALAFMFGSSLFFIVVAFSTTPLHELNDATFLSLLICGLILLVLGAIGLAHFLLVRLSPSGFPHVYSFSSGLAVVSRRRAVRVISYDAIAWVWDKGRRIQTHDGETVVWPDSLEKLPILADLVMRETFSRLSERANASLDAGETVTFGPLLVSRKGVCLDKQFLVWNEVDSIDTQGGLLYFRQREDRPSLSVLRADLPNQHVLWPMLERLRPELFGATLEKKRSRTVTKSPRPGDPSSDQQPRSVHRIPVGQLGQEIGGLLLLIGATLFLSLTGIDAQKRVGLTFSTGATILLVSGLIFGLLTGVWSFYLLSILSTRVRLYSNGMRFTDLLRDRFCHWDDVREERADSRSLNYRLTMRNGLTIELKANLTKFEELVDHIQEGTYRRRLPALLEQFSAGKPVSFGSIVVTRDGVKGPDWSLDWNEITDVQWSKNCDSLRFRKRGSWCSWGQTAVHTMTNSHLLPGLIHAILRGERQA
jgi:hypothetical protein